LECPQEDKTLKAQEREVNQMGGENKTSKKKLVFLNTFRTFVV
jgi:hypothetical protein